MRILDLFCKAGGAAMGLHAVFPEAEIVGVDIEPQPHYPFTFVQGDALTVGLHGYDFIWASPPCQAHSALRRVRNPHQQAREYPDLIPAIRHRLLRAGVSYAMENVVGAPLVNPVRLCGSSFGLAVQRHRLIESSFVIDDLRSCAHVGRAIGVYGDHPQYAAKGIRRAWTLAEGQWAMGIDWMTWRELTQAVPPAYSEYVARFIPVEVKCSKQAA